MTHPPFNAPALEAMNLLLPTFEFNALISSSEHSAVFVARQRSLDRHVAIKILSPHVSADPVFRESFEFTARTMAKLRHPNLIGVYDSGMVDGMLYFVMEFIPGKSLEHSSRGQCVEYSQTLNLIGGICNGLIHAHDNGIFHGGIEPSVILLNQKAEPKISHFGIHYEMDGNASPFMAPEMFSSGGVANQTSDQYAVGAILYQLLTGMPHRIGAPAPSTLVKCDPLIDSVWRKATHPDSKLRFVGMREFYKEISSLLKKDQGMSADLAPAPEVARRGPPRTPPAPLVPPPTESRRSVAKPAVNYWGVVLNVSLLVVLWVVYVKVWKNRKSLAQTQQVSNHIDAVSQAKDEERAIAEAKKLLEEANSKSTQKGPSHSTRPDGKVETQENSLARLRSALVSGKRDEMPVGTVRRASCDYLWVQQPMSWPEAVWFAERHGAHLAIPMPDADYMWLDANVANQQAVWIGAARNGPKTWALADGKSWITLKEPIGSGDYVMMEKDGIFRAEGGKTRLPFVIQWHLDGQNPGAIETLLAATCASLGANHPIFPPGTRTIGDRHFLFVGRPVSWENARKLAESGGGHLAVPATREESEVMTEMASDQIAPTGIWLGGCLKESQWTWITGEPWKTADWILGVIPDAPNSTLLLLPGKGWSSGKPSTLASGFFIEWSSDEKSNPSTVETPPVSNPSTVDAPPVSNPSSTVTNPSTTIDLPLLTRKAKELIVAVDLKRTEQLKLNSKKLIADLDIHIRSMPKSGQDTFRSGVERIKASITNVRVPSIIPVSSGITIDVKIDELIKFYSTKQEQCDAEFLAASGKVHTAYLAKIRDAITQAGQSAEAQSLADAFESAKQLEPWIQSLGVEPKPENPLLAPDENQIRPRRFRNPTPLPPPVEVDGPGNLVE